MFRHFSKSCIRLKWIFAAGEFFFFLLFRHGQSDSAGSPVTARQPRRCFWPKQPKRLWDANNPLYGYVIACTAVGQAVSLSCYSFMSRDMSSIHPSIFWRLSGSGFLGRRRDARPSLLANPGGHQDIPKPAEIFLFILSWILPSAF